MTKIDINRLRKYHADSSAAHGALQSAWAKLRLARQEVSRCKTALESAEHPIEGVRTPSTKAEAAFIKALTLAEDDLHHIEVEHARAERVWAHASAIKNRVREYAIENGQLPSDLRDH